MEEDMDDFGDIYADVEEYVNAGVSMIPSIRQLYLEDQSKAEPSPLDSDEEERLFHDRIGRDGLTRGSPARALSDETDEKPSAKCVGARLVDTVGEETNDSDSDDDLRIVLNEEDCSKFIPSPGLQSGHLGLLAGAITNELTVDDSAVGNGQEQSHVEMLHMPIKGAEQSTLQRCGPLNSCFTMPYSQLKYRSSQSSGHLSNATSDGQGYGVSFTTSTGDWEESGSSAAPATCHLGLPLHRNRTIFDVSIESFDWKPWRNQGVDITEFFNFGLNEETWKQYCRDMVLFRKRATGMATNTICRSIKPDQPKGKAIKVEGGSGERLPSVDIRRSRYQDSDVVIQVPVECSEKDAKMPTLFHGSHRNEEALDCDKGQQPETKSTLLIEPAEEVLPDSEGVDSVQVFCNTIAFGDDIFYNSHSSSPESNTQVFKSNFSVNKLQNPAKKSPLGSIAACNIPVGSSCGTSYPKRMNAVADSLGRTLCPEERRCLPEADLCNAAEDNTEFAYLEKKDKHYSNSFIEYSIKLGKKSSFNCHSGENTFSVGETFMSRNIRSWRAAEKCLRKQSHAKCSYRSELDHLRRVNPCRRHEDHLRREFRHNEGIQIDVKIPKANGHGWPMEFAIHKERPARPASNHRSGGTEKYQNVLHSFRTEDNYTRWVKPDDSFDDTCLKEYTGETALKQFPRFHTVEVFQEDFDRNELRGHWDKRSSQWRRERYDQKLSSDMDGFPEYVEDGKLWRYSHSKSSSVQSFRCSNGGVWHKSRPPRFYDHDSWKSNEVHIGHCPKETQFENPSECGPCNMDHFSYYRDDLEIGGPFCPIKERTAHARKTPFGHGRERSYIFHRRQVTEEQSSLTQKVLDDAYPPDAYFSGKKVYKLESSCDKQGLKVLHCQSMMNENRRKGARKKCFTAKEQNSLLHRETVDGFLNNYEEKSPEKFGDVLYKRRKNKGNKMLGFNHVDELSWKNGDPGKRRKMEVQDTQLRHSAVHITKQYDSMRCGTQCNGELDDHAVTHVLYDSELEEGQLLEFEDDNAGTKENKGQTASISSTKVRHAHNENKELPKESSHPTQYIEYDESHILETLAKMEKRRQRFKDPIAPQEQRNAHNTLSSEVNVASEEVKLERPARKRCWGAVKSSAV